ncbi:sodium:neurotransmitter symporter family domain-containing protein [Ditylenchus destructor]|uniref:Sodium:neurotransmitter symporter family domain-containing protein n=1 Tax=Ditylenchus destructor TaxID=166010 RepID=A0AAD4MRA7_9BILA|nr:sodium:neurotransmitter symporter family domain-containing protein [Ditylenchus destructor]
MEALPDGTQKLMVSNVDFLSEGFFRCVATNPHGTASTKAELKVIGDREPKTNGVFENGGPPEESKPRIRHGLYPQSIHQGSPMEMTVCVTGWPTPTVKWFKDGVPLESEGPEGRLVIWTDDRGIHHLAILNLQPDDEGEYSLVATNPLGEARTAGNLGMIRPRGGEPGDDGRHGMPFSPGFNRQLKNKHMFTHMPTIFDCLLVGYRMLTGKCESFVLDSPLYRKQIKIVDKETVIHDKSDVAPVAYLRLNKLSLTKAKALDLALIRYFVMTHSKENGDEVEDLHPDTKGVSVAAINSTYRKERLENFSGVEAFITGFCDEILDISREIFVAVVICVYYFGSLPTVTYGGTYVIPFLDEYGVSLSVLFIVVCEMIAVCCFYGMRRFSEDIRLMLCFYPGLYWRVCWICCPFFIRFISALALISASFKPLVMEGYSYPIWSVYLGWIFRLLSCLSVPVYIVYLFCITKGSFFQRVKLCITAQQRAGSMNSTCPSLVAGNPGGTALAVDDRGNYHLVNLRSLIQSSLKFLLGGLIFLNLITCGSGAEITLKDGAFALSGVPFELLHSVFLYYLLHIILIHFVKPILLAMIMVFEHNDIEFTISYTDGLKSNIHPKDHDLGGRLSRPVSRKNSLSKKI